MAVIREQQQMLFESINLQVVYKPLRSSVQYSEYRQQCYIIIIKTARY